MLHLLPPFFTEIANRPRDCEPQNNLVNFFAPFRSFFLGSLRSPALLHPFIEYHT